MKNFDWNKLWFGLIIGFITPLIVFAIYYAFVAEHGLRRVNVSICISVNLLPFYLTLNREKYNATKGVLIGTFGWALIVALLSFFTNYLRIL